LAFEVLEVLNHAAGLLIVDTVLEVVHTNVDFGISNVLALLVDALEAGGSFGMD
jgi:hypothetical protein